jgi:hypothetical protein
MTVRELERQLSATQERSGEALDAAWGVIVNEGDGDWSRESQQWREAATQWIIRYCPPTAPAAPRRSHGV